MRLKWWINFLFKFLFLFFNCCINFQFLLKSFQTILFFCCMYIWCIFISVINIAFSFLSFFLHISVICLQEFIPLHFRVIICLCASFWCFEIKIYCSRFSLFIYQNKRKHLMIDRAVFYSLTMDIFKTTKPVSLLFRFILYEQHAIDDVLFMFLLCLKAPIYL